MKGDEFNDNKWLIKVSIIVLIFLFISSISVIFSYNLFSSRDWQEKFGYFGWIIEITRSILISIGTILIIGNVFSVEAEEFLSTRYPSSKLLKILRFVFITSAISGTIYISYYHYSIAPSELSLGKSDSFFLRFQKPYLWYLPYSFINNIVLGLPTFFVGLYASLNKMNELNKNKLIMMNELKLVTGNDDLKKVGRLFEEFCLKFIESIGQYSSLYLILIIIFIFEKNIGMKTLSNLGKVWTLIDYSLIGISLFLIFLGFSFYEKAFQEFSRRLFEIGFDIGEFEDKNTSRKILLRILNRHLGLWIAYLLIPISFPAFSFIRDIAK
jgi:hypothetical protein